MRVVATLAALVGGLLAGAASALVHQWWWGLALGAVAAGATVVWLAPGWLRLAFATGWCVAVARATLSRPEGDYLVPANDRGWLLLATTLALALAALTTLPRRRGRADDQGDRPSPT